MAYRLHFAGIKKRSLKHGGIMYHLWHNENSKNKETNYQLFNQTVNEKRTYCGRGIDKYISSLDLTPSRTLGAYVTHESIFDFRNHCIPLQTSYNSSEGENGRPTAESKGETLSDSGEKTKDLDSNADR